MWKKAEDENVDSGAVTESDSSRMSTSSVEPISWQLRQQRCQQKNLLMNLHLLANPGDSLLFQQTLDHILFWLCPSLCIFHVSERASPYRGYIRLCPVAGYPSLAITFFLHEAYGKERILKVLDFFQRPPWQFHHTENCSGQTGGVHISSSSSPPDVLLHPYLLPSRDFYSLGAGMPVWGVRPVHCGGEILRVTLYSEFDNYEDTVRFYETVLQQQAKEQKRGFCCFTLHTEPGLCLQLALKQLSLGVRVEPCNSAVLQFNVEDIGQLVPLLPNPCTPISSIRWQTEDLDGNKVLFQVKTLALPQRPLSHAFPLTFTTLPTRETQATSSGQSPSLSPSNSAALLPWQTLRQGYKPHGDPVQEKVEAGCRGAKNQGLGSIGSTPSGSSCYSSQCSSPAPPFTSNQANPLLNPSITHSLGHLVLEKKGEETNVDTGIPVSTHSVTAVKELNCPSSVELLMSLYPESPAAFEVSVFPPQSYTHPQGSLRTWCPATCTNEAKYRFGNSTMNTGQTSSKESAENQGTIVEPYIKPPSEIVNEDPVEEFFI